MSDAFKTIHIKGPWEADEGPFGEYAEVYGPDGDRVAQVEDNLALEESANQRARLISQAPAMQEEIKRLRERIKALEQALRETIACADHHYGVSNDAANAIYHICNAALNSEEDRHA